MILCIDAGNTNVVLGLYDNASDKLLKTYKSDKIVENSFRDFVGTNEVEKVIISSVNINVNDTLINLSKSVLNLDPVFIKWDTDLGVKNKLSKPEELGADLLIGGYAATIKYGVPNIVVDMGTATTMFVTNKNKEMLGGVITAGAVISYKELLSRASLLKNAEFLKPNKVIGRDTNEAISSGILYGNAIMIDGLVKNAIKELNEENVKVIITGGMANIIYRYLEGNYIHDDNLLLDGLYEASKIL